jgi:hypothetical protein
MDFITSPSVLPKPLILLNFQTAITVTHQRCGNTKNNNRKIKYKNYNAEDITTVDVGGRNMKSVGEWT